MRPTKLKATSDSELGPNMLVLPIEVTEVRRWCIVCVYAFACVHAFVCGVGEKEGHHQYYICSTQALHLLQYTGTTSAVHRHYIGCTQALHPLYTGTTSAVHRHHAGKRTEHGDALHTGRLSALGRCCFCS